jgi:hypothetical protein
MVSVAVVARENDSVMYECVFVMFVDDMSGYGCVNLQTIELKEFGWCKSCRLIR